MMKNLFLILTALAFGGFAFGQSVTATYNSGDIPTNYGSYDPTCNGAATPLVVSLPTGTWEVTGVDVAYDFVAFNGAYKSEQRSQLACQESGTDEGTIYSGSGTGGTQSYSRTNLSFANGFFSGDLTFGLQAYRTWGGSGCGATYNYIDDGTWTVTVYYQAPPTCPDPSAQTETNITLNSVDLGWTENGSASNWDIEYGANGFTQGTGTTITGTITNPHSLTGLTANTSYDWYVRADCGGGDLSDWVGPNTFSTADGKAVNPDPADDATDVSVSATTFDWDDVSGDGTISYKITIGTTTGGNDIADAVACATSEYTYGSDWDGTTEYFWTVTTVYNTSAEVTGDEWSFTSGCATMTATISENFDDVTAPALPDCWSSITVSPSTVATYTSSSPNSGINHMRLYNSYSSTANAFLVSPELSDLSSNTNQVRFQAKSSSNGQSLLVGTITDPADAGTFTQIESLTLTTSYDEYIVTFTSTTDAYIAFKHGHGGTYRSIYIDDVNYEPIPSCPYPSDQTEANITSSSADLGWTENGSATTWQIEYGIDGFTQGTGTTITDITSNPYLLNGLSENTVYDWYVRADCDDDDYSSWIGPNSFTTIKQGETCADPLVISSLPYITTDNTSNYGDNYSSSDEICSNSSYLNGDDVVYAYTPAEDECVNITLTNTGTWVGLFVYAGCDPFITCVGSAVSSTGNPLLTDLSLTGGTTYYMLISTYPSPQSTAYDLEVSSCPTCLDPTTLTEANVGSTTVDLGWTETGTATTWEIEYGADGFVQGNGTTITGITDNPYSLSGLGTETAYDWYVRSDCGSSDYSIWVGPGEFTTLESCPDPSDQTESNITLNSVDLGWTENGAATTWDIELGANGFTPTGNPTTIGVSNPYTYTGLTANTSYEWYVRADCGGGDYSEWVGPNNFSTADGKAENPDPADDATDVSVSATTLDWDDVSGDGTISYKITIGTTTGGNDIADAVACATSEYTFGTDWDGTTEYFWTVTTVYNTSLEVAGDEWSFTTACAPYATPFSENFDGSYEPDCWYEAYGDVPVPAQQNSAWFQSTNFANTSGNTKAIKMNVYSTDNDWLISPEIDLGTGNKQISFKVAATSYNGTGSVTMSSDDKVYVLINADGTWDLADAIVTYTDVNSPSNTGDEETFVLTGWTGNVRFAFYTKGTGTSPDMDIHFDDFVVEEVPSCIAPSDLAASSIILNSAQLGWTENGSATTWDIELGTNGFTPTGTPTATGVSNPYTYTSLTANTSYDWYVRADCGGGDYSEWVGPNNFSTADGKAENPDPADDATDVSVSATTLDWDDVGGDGTISYKITIGTTTGGNDIADGVDCATSEYTNGSDWSGVSEYFWTVSTVYNSSLEVAGDEWSFTTECTPVAATISQDFDGVTVPDLPQCWSAIGPVSPADNIKTVSSYAYSSPNRLQLSGIGNIFVSPEFSDLSSGSNQVRFYARGWTSGNDLQVGTLSDPADHNTFTQVQLISGLSTTYTEYSVMVSSTTDSYIGFRYSSGSSVILLDDIVYEPQPTCPNPSDMAASSITINSAQLGWAENGSATTWDIELGTNGFTPTGTPTATGVSNPFTYTGLTANTSYDWYVRADCGGGDYSEWVGPNNFSTTDGKAINPDPADDATDVSVSATTLDWDDVSGDGTISYKITIGTITGGNDIADGVACATSEYTYGSNWDATTEYFWTVTTVYNISHEVSGDEWSFTTAVGSHAFPLTEDFESGFDKFDNAPGNGLDWALSGTLYHGASGQSAHNAYTSSDVNILHETGIIDLSSTSIAILEFWHIAKTEGGFDKCYVEISTNGGQSYTALPSGSYQGEGTGYASAGYFDEDDYTQWGTGSETPDNTWWKQETFDLSDYNTTNVRFRFRLTSDGSVQRAGWYIDDIQIYEPTCPDPSDQTEASITATSVELGWTENGTATTWDIEYGPDGFTPGTGTTLSGITSNPYTLSGLSSETAYDWYVRSDCGGGDYSEWAGPGDFTTLTSCPDPSDLSTSAATLNSAQLSWTENGSATTWDIELGETGFMPTGTPTVSGVTSNPYTYNGLIANTGYDWYVRSDCGGGDFSDWVGPNNFTTAHGIAINPDPADGATDVSVSATTLDWDDVSGNGTISYKITIGTTTGGNDIADGVACATSEYTHSSDWDATTGYFWTVTTVYNTSLEVAGDEWSFTTGCIAETFPYSEDFDGLAPDLPSCWVTNNGTAVFTTTGCSGSTNESLQIDGENGAYAYSAMIDVSGQSSIQVEYYYRAGGTGCGNAPEAEDNINVDYWDGTAWVNLANYDGTAPTTFTKAEHLITSGLTADFKLRFHMINGSGAGFDNFNFDDIAVDLPPTCLEPSAQTEANILLNSVQFGWTENGSATTWDIELGTAGFTPTGTPTATGVTSNPYTYTGLIANTSYDWYVRANCGSGDYSEWVGPNTFSIADGVAINPTPADNALDVALDAKTFNWDDVAGADSYKISIGTDIGLSDIVSGASCPASTYTFTGPDWDGNEDYYWTVTTVYNTNQEVVGDEWAFMTVCGTATVPYSENFDDVAAPAIPNCMTSENTNADAYTWVTNATYDRSAPNCAFIRFNGSEAMNDWMFTEGLSLTGGTTYQLDFAYRVYLSNFPEKLSVYWGTEATSAAMANDPIFDETLTNATYEVASVSFTPETNGTYYIGFHGHSDADRYYLMIDDISVVEATLTATWTGAAKSNDWHTAGNWDTDIPGPATDVVIPASLANYPTISSAAFCNDITLKDGATLIGQEFLTVNGTVAVEKAIVGYTSDEDGWYAISAPVNAMTIAGSDFEPVEDEDDFYAYDQAENIWRNFHDPVNPTTWFDEFDPATGYLVGYAPANAGTKSFTGDFNKEASYVVNPSNSNTGWTMIGNPYPSNVNWDGLGNTSVSSPKLMNQSTGAWEDIGTELGVGEGIFVYAESGSASLTFELSDQTHGAKKKETDNVANMKLKANFGDLAVQLLLLTNENASQAYEWKYDARYFYPATQIPYLCAISSDDIWVSKYAFKPSNQTSIIPLYFKVNEGREITFNIEDFEKWTSIDKVTLEDSFLNTYTVLTDGKDYTFAADPYDDTHRFYLHIETSTGLPENPAIDGLNIYTYNNNLYLNCNRNLDAQLSIYNVTGQEIMHRSVHIDGLKQIGLNVNTGWYLVKVISEEGISSRKVFIN